MSESQIRSEGRRETPEPELTWQAPRGALVYGQHRNAPLPDLQRPWVFYPQKQPVIPQPPPVPAPMPVSQQRAAQPAPAQTQPMPAPASFYVPPPSPLGPALTPEERWEQLFGPPHDTAGVPPAGRQDAGATG